MERLNQIINHFGKENQLAKLQEESMELVKATVKYTDNPSENTFKELLSELVDVTILIKQLGYTEGINDIRYQQEYDKIADYKAMRTMEIIKECRETGKNYEEVRREWA